MGKNWLLLIFCFFIFTPLFVNGQNFNEFLRIPIPGRIEGKGTHFEIKDSNYLNITLESEKEIEVVLESIPRMVSLNIASSTDAISTNLTISGLEPNKTYYKYQDSYKNKAVFSSDENGSYQWHQDLTQPHHIWFQEKSGTIYIPLDLAEEKPSPYVCNFNTGICTLTQDINESVEITANDITLDCKGYKIIGNNFGFGVYVYNKSGVIIKNCTITNFSYGIHAGSWPLDIVLNNIISKNKIFNNYVGIRVYGSSNTVKENIIENNSEYGLMVGWASNSIINGNSISNNLIGGIYLLGSSNIISGNSIKNNGYYGVNVFLLSSNNTISENSILNNWAGIYLAVSSNNIISKNNISNNDHGIRVEFSSNNRIYHNNFVGNTNQVSFYYGYIFPNIWDNDYPEGGNYWSDYTGVDEKSGPDQDQAGSDGIGDTPYTFYGGQDRYPFIKENGWLLPKNKPPIPIINFSPQNPVKGVKVKFDASSSTDPDPDGKIKEFFWEIKGREEEILATSTATTTTFTFSENGEYQITLTVTDNDGVTSSTSTIIKVEPFSFAIITDLHIGRGYPNYGGEGFDDEDRGEEYYLTQRLRNVVSWINKHKENYSFKFLAVLGDIADTAEKSEFCKAKEILDELEIPYIPIFGNHDVWPYTEKESAPGPSGEDFFERIFWSTSSIPCENASSTKNFEILLREFNFERDIQNPKFKNFIFNYGGINFIGLDFNSREKEKCENCGVKGEGVVHNETINWLKDKLNQLGGKEPVIIFSHAPFAEPFSRGFYKDSVLQNIIPFPQGNFSREELEKISQILQDYENISEGQQILANFGGHIHGFEKLGKELKFFGQFSPIDLYFDANWQYPSLSTVPVLTTEALMVGGNEKNLDNKGLVRVVKIEEKEKIDFSETEFKEPALNPYITFEFKSKIVGNFIYPCLIFVPQTFSKREIDYYLWNFGDGKTERTSPLIWEGKTIHCYSPSSLSVTYNVTLIAVDKETNKSEYITKKVEIREGIIPKIIKIGEDLKDKVELISMELNEKVTEFGRTMRDWVWIKVKHSPSTPVGLINVHFEEATGEIDLSQLKTDVDFQNKKSLLYMPQWPSEIERSKILFVPK